MRSPSSRARRRPRISLIDYAPDHLDERDVSDVETLASYRGRDSTTWVNILGLGDEKKIQRIGEIFSVHPLALADAVNVPQRPKFESFENHHLLITHETEIDEQDRVTCEQVAIIFGLGFVLVFQEGPDDCFDPVRERIRRGTSVRHSGADFLTYALLDSLIDHAFPVLDRLGDRLETLETAVMGTPRRETLQQIQRIRRSLLVMHRHGRQQRDAINAFMREESSHYSPAQLVYLRDVYDHAVQALETIESYRELTVGLVDLYLSGLSNRMNEIMKVLTVMSATFIPITFLAGLYGMNFEFMPELKERWAYPATLVLMVAIVLVMLRFFKRKGWLAREAALLEPEDENGNGNGNASGPQAPAGGAKSA